MGSLTMMLREVLGVSTSCAVFLEKERKKTPDLREKSVHWYGFLKTFRLEWGSSVQVFCDFVFDFQ